MKQEMSLKKTNGVRLKEEETITQGLVHKSYTVNRNFKMNIVMWTAKLQVLSCTHSTCTSQ